MSGSAVGSSKIRPYESQGDSDLPICEICFQTDEAKYVQTLCCTATGRLGAIIIPHTYHRDCLISWSEDRQFSEKKFFVCPLCLCEIVKRDLVPTEEDLFETVFDGDTARALAIIQTGVNINTKLNRSFFDKAYTYTYEYRNKWKCYKGDTVLTLAIRKGYYDMALALIEAGADVNAKHPDRYNSSLSCPLTVALNMQGSTRLVEALIRAGALVNTRDDFLQRTPLHWAALVKDTESVQMLIRAGADIAAKDCREITPLLLAASRGKIEVCPRTGIIIKKSEEQLKTILSLLNPNKNLEEVNNEFLILKKKGLEKAIDEMRHFQKDPIKLYDVKKRIERWDMDLLQPEFHKAWEMGEEIWERFSYNFGDTDKVRACAEAAFLSETQVKKVIEDIYSFQRRKI